MENFGEVDHTARYAPLLSVTKDQYKQLQGTNSPMLGTAARIMRTILNFFSNLISDGRYGGMLVHELKVGEKEIQVYIPDNQEAKEQWFKFLHSRKLIPDEYDSSKFQVPSWFRRAWESHNILKQFQLFKKHSENKA